MPKLLMQSSHLPRTKNDFILKLLRSVVSQCQHPAAIPLTLHRLPFKSKESTVFCLNKENATEVIASLGIPLKINQILSQLPPRSLSRHQLPQPSKRNRPLLLVNLKLYQQQYHNQWSETAARGHVSST